MGDRNPRRASNWKLVCLHCRAEFLDREKVQQMKDHFDQVHGGGEIRSELLWVGRGPAPKPRPSDA
jgi:hypothetical protein